MKYRESEEMYLKTILLLQNGKGCARALEIAETLGVTKPSVSVAVKKLKAEAAITVDEKNRIRLTEGGERRAAQIWENYQVLTELFVWAGAGEIIAQENACRMEHIVSDRLIGQGKQLLRRQGLSISHGREEPCLTLRRVDPGHKQRQSRASEESYLKAIHLLREQQDQVRSVDLIRTMGYTKGAVSRALKRLGAKSYVTLDCRGRILLTETGMTRAAQVWETHRAITAFLLAVGLEEPEAGEEACRMEHVISPELLSVLQNRVIVRK